MKIYLSVGITTLTTAFCKTYDNIHYSAAVNRIFQSKLIHPKYNYHQFSIM